MFSLSLSLLLWLFSSLETIVAVHPANQRSYVTQENGVPFKISGQGKWNAGGGRTVMDIHIEMGASPPLPGAGPIPGPIPAGGTPAPTPAPTPAIPAIPATSSPTPAPTETPGGQPGSFSAEETEGLNTHNKFRAVHNSPPMTLNRAMSDSAATYAREIAASGNMMHSPKSQRPGQGENLSMGCSSNKAQSMKEAIENWYNEVCDPGYQFGVDGSQGGTGHFTQVVWKDSLQLGIGRAEVNRNGMKCAYIVGRYEPLGNFHTGNNDYVLNVAKGSFDRATYCQTVTSPFGFGDKTKQGKGVIVGPYAFADFRGYKRAKLSHKKHH